MGCLRDALWLTHRGCQVHTSVSRLKPQDVAWRGAKAKPGCKPYRGQGSKAQGGRTDPRRSENKAKDPEPEKSENKGRAQGSH